MRVSVVRNLAARVALGAAVHLTTLGLCTTASAQPSPTGPPIDVANFTVRGVDVVFNPLTNGYFVVGALNTVVGVCVNSAGAPTTGLITIKPTSGAFGAFPKAAYSPHANNGAGGFLVVWPEEQPNGFIELRARIVTCNGLVGGEQVISGGQSAWAEPGGVGLDYSFASQRFLVAWETLQHTVKARLVNNAAVGEGAVVDLSSGTAVRPSVVWNPVFDEFGVSYSGEGPNSAFSVFTRVPTGTPSNFSRTTFNVIGGALTTITDVDFNPATGRYLMAWFELAGGEFARVAEFDAGANLVTTGVASTLGSYDALSVAYNPVSGSFLLAGLDRSSDEVLARELNSRGFPFGNDVALTSGSRPVRYPRVAASQASRTWNVTFAARNFSAIANVLAQTSTSGGGPGGAFGAGAAPTPPTPTPPSPPSGGCPTVQPGPGWTCVNGGWLPPSSSDPSGGASGCPSVQPGPGWTCVNGGWLPPTSGASGGGGACPSVQPGPGWTCVNGGWLPPSSSGGSGGDSGCSTVQPGAGWACVNGGWLPPGSTGAPTSSGGGSGCSTVQPGPGWSCVNGGWLPPGAPGAPSPGAGCTTVQPGPGWVCVNGGWLPPGSPGAPSSGGCTTVQPGPGWVCVNGGWVPSDSPLAPSSCSTPQPVAGWVCAGGNWLPPDSPLAIGAGLGGGSSSSCTGSAPAAGWVCVAGGWLPPNHPLAGG